MYIVCNLNQTTGIYFEAYTGKEESHTTKSFTFNGTIDAFKVILQESGFIMEKPYAGKQTTICVNISNVRSFEHRHDLDGSQVIRINFINNIRAYSYMFVQMTDKELLAIFDQHNKYKKLQAKLDAMQHELNELCAAVMYAPGGAEFQEAMVSVEQHAAVLFAPGRHDD